jgi:hypothetical protein
VYILTGGITPQVPISQAIPQANNTEQLKQFEIMQTSVQQALSTNRAELSQSVQQALSANRSELGQQVQQVAEMVSRQLGAVKDSSSQVHRRYGRFYLKH